MESRYFLPYQRRWIDDPSPLRIIEKSRQIGLTTADAYDSVKKAVASDSTLDVWVSSRDLRTAREYLRLCKHWARQLQIPTADPEWEIFDKARDLGAFTLRFKSDRCIFSLPSSPDALVGKTGHIKLDEFAVHRDQRELYRIAKPCTTWGGQLSIISTHRGDQTVFYEILQSIKEHNNPMGWSHHRVTLQDAVDAGLVERINKVSGNNQTREQFVRRLRAECLDEEQWLQEYCCVPADDHAAFITHDMITQCEEPGCLIPFSCLSGCAGDSAANHKSHPSHPSDSPHSTDLTHLTHLTDPSHSSELYAGVDIGRKEHLCVIDVGEKIGDVVWDRLRLELHNATFAEMEHELFRVLELPQLQRACIDATGLGMQLAEKAKAKFGWKVEPITFTAALKEKLAYGLRTALEQRRLRLDPDPKLRADLRGIRREITAAGNFRFEGETRDSHCDRFWAKALRQHAADRPPKIAAIVA